MDYRVTRYGRYTLPLISSQQALKRFFSEYRGVIIKLFLNYIPISYLPCMRAAVA